MRSRISRTKLVKEEKYLGFPIKTFKIVGSKKGPHVMIISGVHGGETSAIQVVYELIDKLLERKNLAGKMTLIPVVNLPAVLARTRESPIDYKNLNGVYPRTIQQDATFSNILRYHIEQLAKEHDFLIDVHSSTTGLFAQHLSPVSKSKTDINLAREFGTEFILIRSQTGNNNNLQAETVEKGAPTIAASVEESSKTIGLQLEVGSGTVVSSLYKKATRDMILRFLWRIGSLSDFESKYPLRTTPKSRVFSSKDTVKVMAPCYGDMFYYKGIGKMFEKNEAIGYVLNFSTLEKKEILSPIKGQLYYRRVDTRIRPLTAQSTTIAGFIPTKRIHNEFSFTRLAKRSKS